jgi:hypothetical protein
MTPLRRHEGPLYRVYSEDEFLGLGGHGLDLASAPVAIDAHARERPRRRSCGAAVTSVSLRWAAPLTGAALLTGAVGGAAALVTAVGHGARREARGSIRASTSPIPRVAGGVLAAAPTRTPRREALQAARRLRHAHLDGHAHRRGSSHLLLAARVRGTPAASAPRTAVLAAQHIALTPGTGSRAPRHADFTFER